MNPTAIDYLNLAQQQVARQKWQLATVNFQQAIQLEPNRGDIYFKLGEAYLQQNLVDQALVCFRKVLQLNPQDELTQFQLGQYLQNQGLIESAVICFCRTIKLNPDHRPAYISLRYIKLESEWCDRLIAFYREILAQDPTIPEALANLAAVLADRGNLTEAIACSRQAIYYQTISENPTLAQIDWQPQKTKPPEFIIIGAGKSGTTSLYRYLNEHPQILLPNKKELRFFDKNFDYGYEWYLAQFPTICDRPELITGEASPSYLFLPHVAQRIKDFAPKTKLIVMLRDPVARSISDYYQNRKDGNQNQTLAKAIKQEISRLAQKNEAQLAYGGGLLSQSLYYYKLQRWLNIFPKQQLLVIKSENFFAHPATVMQQVYQFLELPNIQTDNYQKYNTGFYPQASEATIEQLRDFFIPHNQRLEEFLQMDFNW